MLARRCRARPAADDPTVGVFIDGMCDITGDGPAGQNRALYARDSFDFQMNYDGYSDVQWDQAIAELNIDVAVGDGVITNILGWRDYSGGSGTDVDATINTSFHSRTLTEQNQVSEELRYAGAGNDTQLPNTAASAVSARPSRH